MTTSEKTQHEGKKKFVLTSFASGALAGAIAKTTIAPLDRTKINFQVSRTKRYSFKSAIKFAKQTYVNTGLISMFRGNSATMMRVVPYAAIQFSAHEELKILLNVDQKGQRTPVRRFFAGSLAACTATLFTYPLDTAKARLSVSPKTEYKNLTEVFTKEYKKYGLKTFYHGIKPTLCGVIPYAGASFYTYETCKLAYLNGMDRELSTVTRLLFGAFAGLVGQTTTYPLDIVRRRMQTGRIPSNQPLGVSLYCIWLHEGLVNGLYKGLSMNWLKGPVAVGISFTSYDIINNRLSKWYNYYLNDCSK